jgi:phage shock protein A
LKNIEKERHETIADVEIAKAEQKVNNALTGISERGTDERRQRIQKNRRKQRARADISAEMAGVATEDVEAEFEEFAVSSEAQSEFFGMLGLEEEKKTETAPIEDTKLPE